MNEVTKKLVGLVSSIPTTTAKFNICEACNNSGRVETMEYTGETIPGFMRNGEIVIGYNKWFSIFLLYYQKINPKLLEGLSGIEFAEQLAIAKNKHPKPLDTQYKVLNLVACTKCKSAHYKGIV